MVGSHPAKENAKQTVGQLSIFDYPNGFQEEPAAAPSTAVGDMSNSGAVAAIKVEQIQKFPQKDNTRRFRWKQCLETMYMQVKKLREPVEAINL